MQIAKHMGKENKTEILTTTVNDISSPINTLPEGEEFIGRILVRRFKVNKREKSFYELNSKVLEGIRLTEAEGLEWFRGNLTSDNLLNYIKNNTERFDFFIFLPYCFGITYFGSQIAPEKSILIPCLHDEEQARIPLLRKMFRNCRAIIFNSEEEKKFFEKTFFYPQESAVIGCILEEFTCNSGAFIKKYGLTDFMIYAGRKDQGKNTPLLLDYFSRYKTKNKQNIRLVLTGPGSVPIPENFKDDIIDLGIIPKGDLHNALSASKFLCQPSTHESFSFSIMEAWLCGKPTLVHAGCEVTKSFTVKANAGLYFANYEEFEECINYLLENPEVAKKLGENGRKFVLENYNPEKISARYNTYLSSLIEKSKFTRDAPKIMLNCPKNCKICYKNSDVFTINIWKDLASSIPYVIRSKDRKLYINLLASLVVSYVRCKPIPIIKRVTPI